MTPPSPRSGPDPERRAEVLALLRSADRPLSVSDVAEALGAHRNTARFHLENLVAAGQAEQTTAPPRGNGRPPMLFQASRGWDPTGPRGYLQLAAALVDHLRSHPDPPAAAENAGYRWGTRLAADGVFAADSDPAGGMVEWLEELGFRPESPRPIETEAFDDAQGGTATARIDLRHCPFLELTDDSDGSDDLVCRLHLGMLRGAVNADGDRGALEVVDLHPKVASNRCVIAVRGTD